jgi:hypothetical protein
VSTDRPETPFEVQDRLRLDEARERAFSALDAARTPDTRDPVTPLTAIIERDMADWNAGLPFNQALHDRRYLIGLLRDRSAATAPANGLREALRENDVEAARQPSLLEDEDGAPYPENVQEAFRGRWNEAYAAGYLAASGKLVDDLGAAWRAAEEALPYKGATITIWSHGLEFAREYQAAALVPGSPVGHGPTPAAALRSLASRLEAR